MKKENVIFLKLVWVVCESWCVVRYFVAFFVFLFLLRIAVLLITWQPFHPADLQAHYRTLIGSHRPS